MFLTSQPRPPGGFDEIKHRHVQLARRSNGATRYKVNAIKDSDIADICRKTRIWTDTEWSLNLIVIHDDQYFNDPFMVYTSSAMKALQRHWHISSTHFSKQYAPDYASAFSPRPGSTDWTGLRMRFQIHQDTSITLSHHTPTRTTFGVIHPLNEYYMETLLVQIGTFRRYATEPLLVPLILIGTAMNLRAADFQTIYGIWRPLQKKMKCDYLGVQPYVSDEKVSVRDMPRALTQMANTVVMHRSSLRSLEYACEFIMRELEASKHRRSTQLTVQLHDYLTHEMQRCHRFMTKLEDVLEMAKNQVQMVYAVLQARDNEVNIRYGADMRVISAVTLIFLPGTFVATMFSTSFWNFDPSTTGPIVSKWIWLYWVLTAGLTVAVLLVWRRFYTIQLIGTIIRNIWEDIVYSRRQSAIPPTELLGDAGPPVELPDIGPQDRQEGLATSQHIPHIVSTHTTSPRKGRLDWRRVRSRRWLGKRTTELEKDVELAEEQIRDNLLDPDQEHTAP